MADTNTSISIVAELIDKVSGPLAAMQKQIAEFATGAASTTVTPIGGEVAGTANVAAEQLTGAAVAAEALQTNINAIETERIAEVATSAEAAAVALADADAAEAQLNAEAADTSPLLQEVAAAAAQVKAETEAAAAAMGDGASSGKGGLSSNTDRASTGMFGLRRQILAVSLAIKGIELAFDAVNAVEAAASGNAERYAASLKTISDEIKSIPLVGNSILQFGAFINDKLGLGEVNLIKSIQDGTLDIKTFNDSMADYVQKMNDATKSTDDLTKGMKDMADWRKANTEAQQALNQVNAQAAELEAINSGNFVKAEGIRIAALQDEQAMRLKLSKLGTDEMTAAQTRLFALQTERAVHEQLVKIVQQQTDAETKYADEVALVQQQYADGLITADQMNQKIDLAADEYNRITAILATNVDHLSKMKTLTADEQKQAADLKQARADAQADYLFREKQLNTELETGVITQEEFEKMASKLDGDYKAATDRIDAMNASLGHPIISPAELQSTNDQIAAQRAKAVAVANQTQQEIADTLRNAPQQPLEQFFSDIEHGTKSVKQMFADMLQGIADNLLSFVNSQAANAFLNFLLGTADPKTSNVNAGGGFAGGLVGSLVGAIGSLFGGGAAEGAGAQWVITGASGGLVPGVGHTDSVPALLMPGERVMNLAASQRFAPLLDAMNAGDMQDRLAESMFGPAPRRVGRVQHFAAGGVVQPHAAGGHGLGQIIGASIAPSYENHMNLLQGDGGAFVDWAAQHAKEINSALGHG
jgi:hypothetical protein